MNLKKCLCILLMLVISIAAAASASAAGANDTALVLATAGVNVRSGPGTEYSILGTLASGDAAEHLGDISVDSSGSAWYSLRFQGSTGWVSAKYSKIVNGSVNGGAKPSPLANYANYHDGYVFELSGLMQYKGDTDIPANGCNDAGNMVDWVLEVYQVAQDPGSGEFEICPAPQLFFCSWSDDWTSLQPSSLDVPWERANSGKTTTMCDLYYHWPNDIEIRTYGFQIFLPDNPLLEGPQKLVYLTDDEALVFEFDLKYKGGYSGNGLGWDAKNVTLTKRPVEEFKK